jgi:hypothetical protein
LGDADKVENSGECLWVEVFESLSTRKRDVAIVGITHTTSRSIKEKSTGLGLAFSSPYFYDGLLFGGPSADFVECANNLDTYFGVCRRLMICIITGSTHYDFVLSRLPLQHIQVVDNFNNVLKDGTCNVIGREASSMAGGLLTASGGTEEEYFIGSNAFTKEPLAITTRSDDYEWYFFIETFLQGLLKAEALNITQADASMFPSIPYVGPGYDRMMEQAIGSIGNFGELYKRTVGPEHPRVGLNRLRTDNCKDEGGLIYSIPFGGVLDGNPVKDADGQLGEIVNRKQLRCGVPIVDDYGVSRFNVEICKAISAALFDGAVDHFERVPFTVGSYEAFDLLLSNEVDILVGAGTLSLSMLGRDIQKFALSKPYLFYPTDDETMEGFVLATRSSDHQWSVFSEWIVMSVINAEEMVISKEQGVFSPEVGLFGPSYDRIFRDVILAVGNYGEIYERTMNTTRSGCNRLNVAPHGPQHFPFLFEGL